MASVRVRINLLKWDSAKFFYEGDAQKFIEYVQRTIEAIKQNGLATAIVERDKAIAGETKDYWFRLNNMYRDEITDEIREEQWAKYIEWHIGNVKSIERQIKRYEKEIKKAQAELN